MEGRGVSRIPQHVALLDRSFSFSIGHPTHTPSMATPIIVGVGAITAALVGRHLFRSGIIGGKRAAEEWAKGGFRAKMDRKEAIAILGLK